jgi:hypothetical protein
MKRLLVCLLLVGVVGCGTPSNSKNANPVEELTINDVVGSYEKDSKHRTVFLDNGVVEYYMLMDPRIGLNMTIELIEGGLEKSIKEHGIDSVFAKSAAKQLAAFKEKLAAVGPPEFPKDFRKILDNKWEIKGGEVHASFLAGIFQVHRVEPNGDLTIVAVVSENGSRTDIPKEKQPTLKRIK